MNGTSYYVLGDNGTQYGPADMDLLRTWVSQGRVNPNTRLQDTAIGTIIVASMMPDLFPASSPPVGPTYGYRPERREPIQIESYLVQAILVALFCCQILGIVGIVFAVMADSAAKDGNYDAAIQNNEQAKRWTTWGFVGGLIIYGGVILLVLLGGLGASTIH